jgi:hypothetical protein
MGLERSSPADATIGTIAGLIATIPMTVVMLSWHRSLPVAQRYPLPPRIITDRIAARAPLPSQAIPEPGPARALGAHFAFGAAAGALYGSVKIPLRDRYPVASGIAYGLLVWGVSYLGWVPAAGLMPPATRQPAQRNAMMIGAHVVWGAALGFATKALLRVRAEMRGNQ